MTTKEFIEMLQKADPSGEAHLRMSGGIPIYADIKEGYWDGPYSYIDKDGNYVYSSKGLKVDIYQRGIDDFVENLVDINESITWEEVKDKFKFELTYSIPEHRKEREDSILKSAKESYDEWKDIITNHN